jgi:hypothetical protein
MMVGGARVRRIVPRLLLAVAIDALARQGTVSPVAMADAAARVPAAPRHTRADGHIREYAYDNGGWRDRDITAAAGGQGTTSRCSGPGSA